MAETTKKGDFIAIDFIARIKGSNKIFDLTKQDIAKKEGIYQENKEYRPLVVCLGAGHLLKGLLHIIHELGQVEILIVDLHPSRFDLGQVQHLVDQVEQFGA